MTSDDRHRRPRPSRSPPRAPRCIERGRPLDAVELLRQAVAAGEPSGARPARAGVPRERELARRRRVAGPAVAQGHVRFAGRLGVALVEIGERERAE